jgi:hypothetical protein
VLQHTLFRCLALLQSWRMALLLHLFAARFA